MELPKVSSNKELERLSRDKIIPLLHSANFLVLGTREEDNGVDLDVEIKTADNYTNITFNIQLKATDSIKSNPDGSYSKPIKTSNINYLLNGLYSVYILYVQPVDKFFFEFAEDFLSTLNNENPSWENQATNTLRFKTELNDQGFKLIYYRVHERGNFYRKTITENIASGLDKLNLSDIQDKFNSVFTALRTDDAVRDFLKDGQIDKAITLAQSKLKSSSELYAKDNFQIAQMLSVKSALSEAIKYFRIAYEIEPSNYNYAVEYAVCSYENGDTTTSANVFKFILDSIDLDSTKRSQILNGLATSYKLKGDFENAKKHQLEAISIYHSGHKVFDIWSVQLFNNIALIYYNLFMQDSAKKYLLAKALSYLNKAVDIANVQPKHSLANADLVFALYNHLGLIYKTSEAYKKAMEYYEMAGKIVIDNFGKDNLLYSTYLNNIGGLLFISGKTEQAMKYILQVETIEIEILGNNHPRLIKTYFNKGFGYFHLNNFVLAKENYLFALKLLNQSPDYSSHKKIEIEQALCEIEKHLRK